MAGKVDVLGEEFRYPDKPEPRAFGYLDKTGVKWAAYDTSQMEEYSRSSYSDGFLFGFQSGCDAVMAPSYDSTAVTDSMIDAAIDAYNKTYKGGQREWMRDALTAASISRVK